MVKIATVEKCFLSPGPQPNGLQAAADGLWYIEQRDNRVYKLDWQTGKTLFEKQTTTDRSSGITIGGGYLWIASTYSREIHQCDLKTGKTLKIFPSPGQGVNAPREHLPDARPTGDHGLEWKDGKLYIASPPSQMVHVMDPVNWRELHRFRVSGFRVHGIAWARDEGMLWTADTAMGVVSKVRISDGRVYDMFRVPAPTEVHGMTMGRDGTLWFCDAETRDVGRLVVSMDPAFG